MYMLGYCLILGDPNAHHVDGEFGFVLQLNIFPLQGGSKRRLEKIAQ